MSHFCFLYRALCGSGRVPLPERDNPTERLYQTLLPNLPQYMIALLKVLLAAAPTSRSRTTDSLNILVDVLPPESPSSMQETNQVCVCVCVCVCVERESGRFIYLLYIFSDYFRINVLLSIE